MPTNPTCGETRSAELRNQGKHGAHVGECGKSQRRHGENQNENENRDLHGLENDATKPVCVDQTPSSSPVIRIRMTGA